MQASHCCKRLIIKYYESIWIFKRKWIYYYGPNGEDNFLPCNEHKIFFLEFLNENGFSKQDNGNRLGSTGEFEYEYGNDSFSGRVRIVIKLDVTNRLYFKFECRKPERWNSDWIKSE